MAPPLPWLVRRASPTDPVPLVLGTMNFGKRTDETEARRIIDYGIERGVILLDTANASSGEPCTGVVIGRSSRRRLGSVAEGARYRA